MEKKTMNTYLKLPLFLGCVAFVMALILGLVSEVTKDAIDKNMAKVAEANYLRVFENEKTIYDKIDGWAEVDLEDESIQPLTSNVVRVRTPLDDKEKVIGFAVEASAPAYNGTLTVILGFDTTGKAVGFVMGQNNETPGYGKEYDKVVYEAGFYLYVTNGHDEKYLADAKSLKATKSRNAIINAITNAETFIASYLGGQ